MDGDFRTHFVRDPAALRQFPALVLNADYRPLSYYPLSLWPWQEAIKAAGVSCVIAKSFARIFYRNSINMGLPILECPEAVDAISEGDVVSVDADTGGIADETTGRVFQAQPFPPFIQEIISDGGLVARTKRVMAAKHA